MKASPCEPELLEVTMSDGKPTAVVLKKRSLKVKERLNMWRIDEEWWREPVSRLYFLLELENGAQITLFRDLIHGLWYRQNWMQ
jgi:hypothetical protein